MRQVSQEEFYAVMNPLDVHPSIQPTPWPYTSLWKLRRNPDGAPIGKSVCRGDALGGSDYYLANAAVQS